MEEHVTLEKVQSAIRQLRENGERVSRRNVRDITGGGMSTVHRIMSQIEDQAMLREVLPDEAFSTALRKAIAAEITDHVEKATASFLGQISQLKGREQEALAALTQAEDRVAALGTALDESRDLVRKDRESARIAAVAAQARQSDLEQLLQDCRAEEQCLRSALENARIDKGRAEFQVQQLEKDLDKSAGHAERLVIEVATTRKRLVEVERAAAVAKQQVQDLRKLLTRAERRTCS